MRISVRLIFEIPAEPFFAHFLLRSVVLIENSNENRETSQRRKSRNRRLTFHGLSDLSH